MRETFLSFSPPDVGEEEVAAVVECLRSGWITTGPRAAQFEQEFAAHVYADAALALNSGTGALQVALALIGVGPSDAVVLPTMTFASAAHAVEHLGARPLFVDSEAETLNVDIDSVESVLDDPSIRCVLPAHLYGHPCDMSRLIELAEARELPIVDDAAHSLPASIQGRPIGSMHRDAKVPVLTAFSFYATKNLTTGEGGMLTGSRQLIDQARPWSLHGMSRDAWGRYEDGASWRYDVTVPGFKLNMSDVQAAIGLVQLRRLDAAHRRRKEIASRYNSEFGVLKETLVPAERPEIVHSWHIYALRLRLEQLSISRNQFIDELRSLNIGASVHFIPIHLFSYYRTKYGYRPDDFPIASREFERLVSLPIHPRMTNEDVDDVVTAVTDIIHANRR